MINSLYRYRWLLYELISRDLVLRYRGSVLGLLWTLLNPILFIAIYTLVFSVFLRIQIEHYAVFLVSGLIAWQWFASAAQAGTSAIVDGGMYVGKSAFPAEVLVVIPIVSNFINYLFSLPLLVVVVLFFHLHVGWSVLFLPLLVAIEFLFTLSLLLLLATFNVFFRDLQQLVVIVLLMAFYLTPVFYPITTVPENFRLLVSANPMTDVVMGYQKIFYYGTSPDWQPTLYAGLFSIVLFFFGRAIFERYKDSFADYV